MPQLLNFIQDHWLLSSVFVLLLTAVLILEYQISQSKSEVSAAKAIDLINHQGAVVFDFRSKEEFANGHIVNSINVQLSELSSGGGGSNGKSPNAFKNSKNKKFAKYSKKFVIVVCAQRGAAEKIIQQLKSIGISNTMNLSGGIQAWVGADLPLVKDTK